MVPGAGIEPARLSAGDFESPASTNFTTRAVDVKPQIMAQYEAMNDKTIEVVISKTSLIGWPECRLNLRWGADRYRSDGWRL